MVPHLAQALKKILEAFRLRYILVRHCDFFIRGRSDEHAEELLKDETTEVDLVGPTLPALKALLDVTSGGVPVADVSFSRLVHGLISCCLQNIEETR